jgi:O-antigen ligase
MDHPGAGRVQRIQGSVFQRTLANIQTHVTLANLVGLIGSIFVLACFLTLPVAVSIRLLLYLTAAIWTMLRPRMALYFMPIAVPWGSLDAIDLGGSNLNSADILVFLLAASWLLSFPIRKFAANATTSTGSLDREDATVPRYLVLAMFLLIGTMCLSMITATSLSLSLKEIVKWLELAILLLLGAQYIRTRRQIWILVTIVCLAALSQAFFGYIQAYFDLGPQAFTREGSTLLRVYGTFDQPNPYAGYINITLAIVLALTLLAQNVMLRILAGMATILLAIAVYLSQSRGGELAIAAALLFIIIAGFPRLRLLAKIGAIIALAIVGAYCAGLVPQHYLMPILKQLGLAGISLTAPNDADYSTAERLAHWIAGINMFLDHPIFGVGIGNYPVVYPKYFITIFVLPLGHAHNYYINIAAEAGIVGLTGFMLFLVAIFVAGGHTLRTINTHIQQIQRQKKDLNKDISEKEQPPTFIPAKMLANDRALAIGLLAALVSICVHNLVDDLFVHSITNLFALLLALLIRLEGVMPNVGSNGGHFAYRESSRLRRCSDQQNFTSK